MANLTSVLKHLERERIHLRAQLKGLNDAVSALNGTSAGRARRGISAAGRARIAAAQRARWAKSRGPRVVSITGNEGRTVSPAARRRIVAAQKARWAKWRKAQKRA